MLRSFNAADSQRWISVASLARSETAAKAPRRCIEPRQLSMSTVFAIMNDIHLLNTIAYNQRYIGI